MEKNLIIQFARFGDLVQTRRLILGAQKLGDVHLLVDRSLGELARLIYPKVTVHELVLHRAPDENALLENEKVFGELAAENFDRVVNCNFSGLSGAVCRLFDRDKVLGYRSAHDSDGGLLRSPWTRLTFRISKMRRDSPLNLVDFWAWFLPDPVAPAKVNPEARGKGRGIGVVMAGRESRRSLPPPVLAKIVNLVFSLTGKPEIRLFGTEAESHGAKSLMRLLGPAAAGRCIDLCGKTGWKGLIGELDGLDLVITPDTGVMHLAAFLGVPVMAFFLSSALCHETGPYGAGHMIWQAVTDCAPCLEKTACERNVECLAPFSDAGFSRFLAGAITGDARILARMPAQLQLWTTGFDAIGIKLALRAGEDRRARQRKIIRVLVGNHLGLPGFMEQAEKLPARETALLAWELFPEDEWMLPRKRYC